MRVTRCLAVLALLIPLHDGYSQQPPASTTRFENDTFNSVFDFLRNGDTDSAMNLINRDPLTARFALIRLLRERNTTDLAARFASLFPANSWSELEIPILQTYSSLEIDARTPFLDWIDGVSNSELILTHNKNSGAWMKARAEAMRQLEQARAYFNRIGFKTGEAHCLRIMAAEYFTLFKEGNAKKAETFSRQATSIFDEDGNSRGAVLCLIQIGSIYQRLSRGPEMRQVINEALQRTRQQQDLVSELNLMIETRGVITNQQRRESWTLLENQPGLRWLKYRYLAALSSGNRTYRDIFDEMLVHETDPVMEIKAQWLRFNVFRLSEFEGANEASEQAIAHAGRMPYNMSAYDDDSPPDPPEPAMLAARGVWFSDHFQHTRALAELEAAMEANKRVGSRSELDSSEEIQNELLSYSSYAYELMGEYGPAIEQANAALAISERLATNFRTVNLLGSLARMHAELGDTRSAEDEFRRALRIPTPLRNPAYTQFAQFYIDVGRYEDALKVLDEFEKKETVDFPQGSGAGAGLILARLKLQTLAWLRIGDLNRAMSFAKALEARLALLGPDFHIEEGVVGMVLIEMKRYPEAENYFKHRLALSISEKDIPLEADAHKYLGRVYRLQNRQREALDHLNRALQLYREIPRRRDELQLLVELGQVAMQGSDPTASKDYFTKAVDLAEDLHSLDGAWSAHAGLASLENTANDANAAADHLRRAVVAVESVSVQLHAELNKSTFIENKIGIYDDLIQLIGPSHPAEAFHYAERRRTQSYLEAIRRQGVLPATESDLVRALKNVEARLIGKQGALMEQMSKSPERKKWQVREKTATGH